MHNTLVTQLLTPLLDTHPPSNTPPPIHHSLRIRWLAFECCESTVTTHVVENKCHPSNCADWSCDDWCKCFEQDVESEQHYDQEKCGDDGSVCSCCTGVNGAYDCAKGDYFGVL